MFRAITRTRIHWIAPCRPRFAIAPSRHATPSLIGTRTASSTSTTVIQPTIKGRSKQDIMKFLYGHQQRPVPGGKPNTILTHCPHCLYVRKSSFAASVNIESGTYSCKTCHSSGSWQQFTKALRKKLAHNNRPDYIIHGSSDLFSNTQPAFEHSIEKVAAFPSQLSDSALTTVAERYHLRPEVMRMYQVGLGEYKDTACLTFPQTVLVYGQEDDAFQVETMRIKACGLEDDALVTYDPPTATHHTTGLFGYHTIPSDADTIILTRREVDAMAAYQATGVPSVSLPTSDYYQLHESVLPLLERFSKIYVWMDKDMDGQMASERFASKLGDARCLLINNQPLPHDALAQGDDLTDMLQSAQSIKHDEIMDFTDLRDLVQKEVLYPEQTQGVQSTDLPSLNTILKGHRPGELTILTGPTGAGKTTIISQISLDYCKSGVPTLWGSFEIVNRRLAKKMLYQYAGKDISKSPEEFDHWASEFQQLPLYFLKFFSSTAVRDVLDACRHAVYAYDVRHIILDNLQFMLSQQGRSHQDRWELQDDAIAELRRFATEQDVHITLVVHPRKDSGEQLDINSVFGSAKVTQEADNVIIIQRVTSSLDIKKNRFDGMLGSIPYKFNRDSLKIEELSEEEVIQRERAAQRSTVSSQSSRTVYPRKRYP